MTPKGVAVVRMDVQGEKQNTFNEEFYRDMEAMVEQVEKDDSVKAVVLASGKKGSWIAGANIKQIEQMKSADEAASGSALGQQYFDRIANMQKRKPWIAAIDGACLGGGMEFSSMVPVGHALVGSLRFLPGISETGEGVVAVGNDGHGR